MNRRNTFRLMMTIALGLAASGFGPGSCGPAPEQPCEGLDEQECRATPGCMPLFAEALCDCAAPSTCAAGEPCGACECPQQYAGCGEEIPQPPPPPPSRCEGLDENTCLSIPGCQPVYYDGGRCGEHGPYAGCVVAEPPPPPPPPACETLDEQACLARLDCQAIYDRCGGGEERCMGGFAGCVSTGCDPVICTLACPNGFVRDERGCEICSCQGSICFWDGDCAPGERCELPETPPCEPGVGCAAPAGTCVPVSHECRTDADCGAGERCELPMVPPCREGSDCYTPAGVCVPVTGECRTDGDCAPGEVCLLPDCGPEADCVGGTGICQRIDWPCVSDSDCRAGQFCEFAVDACPPGAEGCPNTGVCRDLGCSDDASCPAGSVCRPDPSDPCNQPNTACFAPGRQVCMPACAGLDEQSCLQRRDCRGVWGSGCDAAGNCTPDRAFYCEDATVVCPDVYCELWCPNGFVVDENGCNTCECKPGCTADEECPAGQRCEIDEFCDPATGCNPIGVCRAAGCMSDSDCPRAEVCIGIHQPCPAGVVCDFEGICAPEGSCLGNEDCNPGEACLFLMYDCVGEGCSPGWGTCSPMQPGCSSDAECGPGERCELVDCGGADCGAGGVCVPVGCASDADCAAGERCSALGGGVCVPAGCLSDSDCAPGEQCVPSNNCGPGTNCGSGEGICQVRQCTSDAQCPAGTICRDDPNDPCSQPNVLCDLPPRQICQLPCAQLDEASCHVRFDCSATYAPAGSGTAMVFIGCVER